jgi:pyruvate-formate lyase-activating enzyme
MANTIVEKLSPAKFQNPDITAKGEIRAHVSLKKLDTLWFNTGTLCNLECVSCYIESSPRNDKLVYITVDEVKQYLDEIQQGDWDTREIGFTGGEPFMNPQFVHMAEECLRRGFKVLVLTNGMRPMMKCSEQLLALQRRYGDRLTMRLSIDHYTQKLHEEERGARSWKPTLEGLLWLGQNGFNINIAGRSMWHEEEQSLRAGYARLFAELDLDVDASDPRQLIIFPEMDLTVDVPEITTQCWEILEMSPDEVMCSSSRMVVKRKDSPHPVVLACTLLPYEEEFEMGATLKEAASDVKLNHPHCAKFCVLGGGSCSVDN